MSNFLFDLLIIIITIIISILVGGVTWALTTQIMYPNKTIWRVIIDTFKNILNSALNTIDLSMKKVSQFASFWL